MKFGELPANIKEAIGLCTEHVLGIERSGGFLTVTLPEEICLTKACMRALFDCPTFQRFENNELFFDEREEMIVTADSVVKVNGREVPLKLSSTNHQRDIDQISYWIGDQNIGKHTSSDSAVDNIIRSLWDYGGQGTGLPIPQGQQTLADHINRMISRVR